MYEISLQLYIRKRERQFKLLAGYMDFSVDVLYILLTI